MEKSRLGISVGLLAAGIYLVALFGGYIPLILLAGYVLLFEGNQWLRKSAVKAAVIVFAFALLAALIGFIPNFIELINNAFYVFDKTFAIPVLPRVIVLLNTFIFLVEKLFLIVLGINALKQGGLPIEFIDKTVNKHIEQ